MDPTPEVSETPVVKPMEKMLGSTTNLGDSSSDQSVSRSSAAPGRQNAADVLASAIENVVDKKFRSLEAAIANLEQIARTFVAAGKISEDKGKKESGEGKEKSKDGKEGKEGKDGKESKEGKEGKDGKEGKAPKEGKDKEGKGDGEKKEKKDKPPFREVGIAYKVNCVSDISEVSCTFVVDMKVFFNWKDDKLIGRKSGATINYEEEKGLFDPDIVVSNEHDLHLESSTTKITDSATGEVKRTNSYKGTVFLLSMNLKSFPFDCQNLQICFKPYKLSIESVKLVPKPASESAMDHPVIHEWNVEGHCAKSFETDPSASSTGKVYSTVFVTILIRRKYGWFVTNVFTPTAAFLLISWLTFAFGAENRGERNDVSMATLLASIANKYVVCDQIPKVDYRTLLDKYVDCCFALQVLTLFASAIVFDCAELPLIGPYVNSVFFLLEFLAAALFHEWLFVRLFNHELDIENWIAAANNPDEGAKAPKMRRASKLVWALTKCLGAYNEDFNDGHLVDNDAEHFSTFGASIVGNNTANLIKKQIIQDKIEEQQTQSIGLQLAMQDQRCKLRDALLTGDRNLIMNAATRIVQSVWRVKRAKKMVIKLKKEKDMVILEGAARKIQKIFRMRVALRKRRQQLTKEQSQNMMRK